MYLGSPDSKDLLTNKHIMNCILALIDRECNSIAFGMFLSVLYLGIFKKIRTAALIIIWRLCDSVFGSPYNVAMQKSICVRAKHCTSFSVDKLWGFCKFYRTSNSLNFFSAAAWYLEVKFSSKTTTRFLNVVDKIIPDWSSFKFDVISMFLFWRG